MDIDKHIPILLDKNKHVDDVVAAFSKYQHDISSTCFNDGKPLRAVALHRRVYRQVPTSLGSQMRCSAIRLTAGTYASVKARRGFVPAAFTFRNPNALFLYGRDFSFKRNGEMSISTLQGRERIGWSVPSAFQADLDSAKRIRSLTISRRGATLFLTIEVPDPIGVVPVGVDIGINNAVAAATEDSTLLISGITTAVRNTRTRKRQSRLQRKLAERKAQHQDTRSIRRALKRLSHEVSNRNDTFCKEVASRLCTWAPSNSILILEDLKFKSISKNTDLRRGTRRRLNGWPFRYLIRAIENCAKQRGLAVAYVNPAYTSQVCSNCGLLGCRNGSCFRCPHCGAETHADLNAARNIRLRFTVLRSSGLPSTSPEAQP